MTLQLIAKVLAQNKIRFPVLLTLNELPSTPTAIATANGITTAAATGLIERMESMGLATREFCKEDRRSVDVLITPKGIAMRDAINRILTPN